ncbi:MAG TPA: hypothetical protein PK765_01895 [bacterium]|nr:hypothetical protein [bacterium]
MGHPPETCPECGGADIATIGVGTQAIESRLQTLFPSFRIVRLDADSGESA